MNMIKNIEAKIKLALWISILAMATAIIICTISLSYATRMITKERNQIYVLDKNVPLVANETDMVQNRQAEYKAEIIQFHNLFFTLPPDDKYIGNRMNRAMYLVDASGMAQYNTLKEQGYFNNLISTSTFVTCTEDSVSINMNTMTWTYYGKEKLERPSDITIRTLITQGGVEDILDTHGVPIRTVNNPYGCILTHWKTIDNKDLSHETKQGF